MELGALKTADPLQEEVRQWWKDRMAEMFSRIPGAVYERTLERFRHQAWHLAFAFLSSGNGYINNSFLAAFGVDPIDWYNTPKYWPVILVIINVWKNLGYNMILYYATICGIDHTLYEAAVVDGVNRWQQVRNVTLPSLRSTIIILTLMALGGIFRSDFGLFYQVPQNSGPLISVTQTIDTYVYRGLMQTNNIGMSSAAGVYQSVVGFVLVVTANLIVRKVDSESSLF